MRPQALNLVATVEGGGGVLSVDKAAARLDDSTVEGAFRYEVYPSYDFEPIAQKLKQDHT